MKAKEIVKSVYISDALRNSQLLDTFIHSDILLDWHSSKGFFRMNREEMLSMADELKRAYEFSRIDIKHLLEEDGFVTIRYVHYVKTIENPREEMVLANFIVIWELKDDKLFRGYQMSQLN